jgi:hypothetical protein
MTVWKNRLRHGAEKPTTLIVMDAAMWRELNVALRADDSSCLVSTTLQLARGKLKDYSPALVVSSITLPDGTWCDLARSVSELAGDVRFLVAKSRCGELLLGDVVRLGGYFALPPPHRWFSAEAVA